ncbi:hypothetical protein OEZ49_15365 [Ruegeria sp. WL0004]|uniref:Uncharacterized protein n=1 Tax=Ruegeria marisflavi TaxID=2984152 RepID=A0ABT2WTD0_9RHOB|nr:hypothetical protein [Ruegeria sp. WL0004]MCU9839154.1 hypothetical protein [Ruegeria sp. WL0004]
MNLFITLSSVFKPRRDDNVRNRAASFLERNWAKVDALFRNRRLATYIFEPAARLWNETEPGTDAQIRRVISQIAVANAVIAGLPGQLGIGVFVAIALEFYMAIQIARRVGVHVDGLTDLLKYFGLATGVAFTILLALKHILGFFFSFFSLVGLLPATAMAELFATSLVGVIFWVGFQEARENGAFLVPVRLFNTVWSRTRELVKFQWGVVKKGFSKQTYAETGRRLYDWLTGSNIYSPVRLRGDIFPMAAFAHMLAGRVDQLQGPLGQIFMQAIRDTNLELAGLRDQDVATYMRDRLGELPYQIDAEAYQGMESLVRGRMFELLVQESESWNGEGWEDKPQRGFLHEDFNHPGSDIVFQNIETGEMIEVQIKATGSAGYIEETLIRYPDIPIIVTNEVGEQFDGVELVQASMISNDDLKEVTFENFEELLEKVAPISVAEMGGAALVGGAATTVAAIWPFVAAFIRGRITQDQLIVATQRVLPQGGVNLARRVVMAAAIGPLYAWWVLARGVMRFVPEESVDDHLVTKAPRRIVFEDPRKT